MYIFIKIFFKINLFIWFSYFQTQQLKNYLCPIFNLNFIQNDFVYRYWGSIYNNKRSKAQSFFSFLFELNFEGCNHATHVGINHGRAIRVNGGAEKILTCVSVCMHRRKHCSTIPRIWHGYIYLYIIQIQFPTLGFNSSCRTNRPQRVLRVVEIEPNLNILLLNC